MPVPTSHDEPIGKLAGPAVTTFVGGTATRTLSLDNGGLNLAPPVATDRPTISAGTAACVALASTTPDGGQLGDLALAGGAAFGLARVTVDVPSGRSSTYRHRLAWVAIVRHVTITSCPAMTSRTGTDTTSRATDYAYQVFLLDARTGADALTYTEGGPALCGGPGRIAPSISIPTDIVSVPWRLASRDPRGYSAVINATMQRCDGYDPVVLADRDRPALVTVLVRRPIGPPCGTELARRLTLHADVVTASLPTKLVPAPLGLSVPQPPTASPAPVPAGTLRQVTAGDCGKTLTITVGTVLVLPPLPSTNARATSSDTAVLGPLDDQSPGPVVELRAWKAGRAVVTMPGQSRIAGRCGTPWRLTVEVRT